MILSSAFAHLESLFYAAPLSLLPLLNFSTRMDLMDFHKAQQPAVVKNSLGGETKLEHFDDHSLRLRYTPASLWQMQLLPDSSIRVSHTFFARDTVTITLIYNKKWQLIKK